jgi:hypothetical protein
MWTTKGHEMSIWSDVVHDPARAQEAIDELERSAAHLEGLTEARANLARQALIDWHGARRETVEHAVTDLLDRSDELVWQLRRTAASIAEETELAIDEQRRRERLRETIARPTAAALQ